MTDFTPGSGMPGSIGFIMVNTKVFFHQVFTYYVAIQHTTKLRHCARTASEMFYPDIRLDINGSYRI